MAAAAQKRRVEFEPGGEHFLDPLLRDELAAVPLPAIENQLTETRQLAGGHEGPGTAGDCTLGILEPVVDIDPERGQQLGVGVAAQTARYHAIESEGDQVGQSRVVLEDRTGLGYPPGPDDGVDHRGAVVGRGCVVPRQACRHGQHVADGHRGHWRPAHQLGEQAADGDVESGQVAVLDGGPGHQGKQALGGGVQVARLIDRRPVEVPLQRQAAVPGDEQAGDPRGQPDFGGGSVEQCAVQPQLIGRRRAPGCRPRVRIDIVGRVQRADLVGPAVHARPIGVEVGSRGRCRTCCDQKGGDDPDGVPPLSRPPDHDRMMPQWRYGTVPVTVPRRRSAPRS